MNSPMVDPPTKVIVFFDSQCSLCWRTQKLLAQWGQSKQLKFVPLQQFEWWRNQYPLLADITPEALLQGIRVFAVQENKLYVGVEGVIYCLKQCKMPYALVGKLIALPIFKPLLLPLYAWVANNRYKLLPKLTEAEQAKLEAQFHQ